MIRIILWTILAAVLFTGCSTTTTTTKSAETKTVKETELTMLPDPIKVELPVVHEVITNPVTEEAEPVIIAEQPKSKGKPRVHVLFYPRRDSMTVNIEPDSAKATVKETTTNTVTDTHSEKESVWAFFMEPLGITIAVVVGGLVLVMLAVFLLRGR